MNNNWSRKTELKEHAGAWIRKMEAEHSDDIKCSISNTKIYPDDYHFNIEEPESITFTDIFVEDLTTVDAILKYDDMYSRMAALNFASYKNPGGMFLNGSNAQEESLCHSSTLYCVLREFQQSFYDVNRNKLNHALYNDDALYSKSIWFEKNGASSYCDIITIAAPNASAVNRYHGLYKSSIRPCLVSRIERILAVAMENGVNTLILGAFGCGVFGNNPATVANIFQYFLEEDFKYVFNTVVFAIPDRNSDNYKAFETVFTKGRCN